LNQSRPTLLEVVIKTALTHTVTYSIMGMLALTLLNYAGFYTESSLNLMMRKTSDPIMMLAPTYQPIRGILFGLVFYLLREPLFGRKKGWLVMWTVLVVIGIVGTFGPTPGSLEGIFFTLFPLGVHLRGLPEVLLQSLLLSLVLSYWVNHPGNKWLGRAMVLAFLLLAVLFPLLGLWAGQRT
jgi:hypothetical protein